MAKFKRILLKLSGESLMGEQRYGIDEKRLAEYAEQIKEVHDMGVQIGIVVGGGNFWRGVKDGGDRMERTRADHMGMLATVINALAVADCLEQRGVEVRVQTAIAMNRNGDHGTPVDVYVGENVSTIVVKIIQSYVTVVNKMVWRKE